MVNKKNYGLKIILFTLLLTILLIPSAVLANSAPIYQPEPNGTILPMMDTPIIVQEEKLQFIITEEHRGAYVNVQYTFFNPTNEDSEVLLAFPYTPYFFKQSPKIIVNGKQLLEEEVEVYTYKGDYEHFLEEFDSTTFLYIDPITGEEEDDWKGYDIVQEANLVTFPVIFPAQEEVRLQLEYVQDYGIDNRKYINPVLLYQYLLQPARAWQQFEQLSIQILIPKNYYFASNLSFEKDEVGIHSLVLPSSTIEVEENSWDIYTASFPTLPDQNLAFSVLSTKDLFLGKVDKDFYDTLGICILWVVSTLFIFGIVSICSLFKQAWVRWIIGPILSFITTSTLTMFLFALLIYLIPALQYGNWMGGYGVIFSFFFLTLYIALAYFPLLLFFQFITRINKK